MWRAIVLIALALLPVTAARAQTGDCAADTELAYVCGPQKPEDVLALPGTRWLIASGFADGAGLKLVDTRTRGFTTWFTGRPDQLAPAPSARDCPGPVDAKVFNARGLSLRRLGKHRWRLLVVNHGGRQSIELFDIDTRGEVPRLRWRDCLAMPEGQIGNSVAGFADGTVLVTVLTRPGTTIADFVLGQVTGAVWQWRPGDAGFVALPGTALPGNNGLEIDPDQRHFYVVAFGWHAVVVFDRRDTNRPVARIDAPDFMPDNIHWSGKRLLLAGMVLDEPACGGRRRVIAGVADPMLCHRGWVVGELKHGRVTTLARGLPQPGFNGVSAAAIAGGTLWLGSFQSGRLAVLRDWQDGRSRGQPSRRTYCCAP
ncbi:hypothetical protein [Sphingomonas sp. PB4P5]|uniref:hypothetical protein n=1 Tax=Parasphingomonas puruogangriensis TaxID=3096155 RepID=UPI002FCABDF1